MPEHDHFLEATVLFRERDDHAVFVVDAEMPAYIRVFVGHGFRAHQRHHSAGHEPMRRRLQELSLHAIARVVVIEGWIEIDQGEAVHARPATEEAGGRQYMSFRKGITNFRRTAVIQFDGIDHALWAAKQIAELPDGRTFSAARITDRERLGRRTKESCCVIDGFPGSWIKPSTHLSR